MADAFPSSSDHQKLIDRLTNLPEHILLHILSFLPSKHAVATSILSKPWQFLWTRVPAIDLDDNGFSDDGGSSDDGFSRQKPFEQLVSKVLDSNRSPVIRRFFLSCKVCTPSSLDNWLSFATQRNVEELDLTFAFQDDLLPFHSFSSPCTIDFWRIPKSFKTQVVIFKLTVDNYDGSQFVINIGENLEGYFPKLKVLHLSKVWFKSGDTKVWFKGGDTSLSGIFASRFPILEELAVYGGTFHHDINISLPKLKRFEFDCACLESLRELRLNMDAPILQRLVLYGFGRGRGEFREENLHNLLDASLSSRFPLLEDLVIETATFSHDIKVSLPKLRRLNIYSASSRPLQKYTLHVEAPSLQYLDLSNFESLGFRAEDLPNLVEANVDAYHHRTRDNKYDDEYGEYLINLINALFNVRRLDLSVYTMFELYKASSHSFFLADRIHPFHNLVKLDLVLSDYVLGTLMIMLSKFENLEHLKIKDYTSECKGEETECSLASPTYVPNCFIYHLKTFCFDEFICSKYGREFTIYILKNSLVLEKTKIIFRRGLIWKKGHETMTTLSTTPRGSVECQLEFDQDVSVYGSDSY